MVCLVLHARGSSASRSSQPLLKNTPSAHGRGHPSRCLLSLLVPTYYSGGPPSFRTGQQGRRRGRAPNSGLFSRRSLHDGREAGRGSISPTQIWRRQTRLAGAIAAPDGRAVHVAALAQHDVAVGDDTNEAAVPPPGQPGQPGQPGNAGVWPSEPRCQGFVRGGRGLLTGHRPKPSTPRCRPGGWLARRHAVSQQKAPVSAAWPSARSATTASP
jgi:hypothetical protein